MYERQVGFWEAVASGFRNYFRFSGRAQRAEYWWFYLFTVLVTIGLSILDMSVFGIEFTSETFSPMSDMFSLAVLVPTLSLGWRRMHDIGRSGWWNFLILAPLAWMVAALIVFTVPEGDFTGTGVLAVIIGLIGTLAAGIYVIVLLATDSDVGPNAYGPSVKYFSAPYDAEE